MFKIYDLNMKELPFPEGVKPLDIFVSSVNKRRLTEEFEGRSGTLNYGYDYGERSVDLSLWLEAHDTIDYRLIRNELYAFFDTHDVFYIEETRVPSRVLKVTIDESYIPERINQTHSSVEISCRTLDSVFWESKYTTLELHDTGYSATVEKYGLVDNIDDEKVKYRFPGNDNNNRIPMESSAWESGSFYSTGTNNNNSTDIRTAEYITVTKGATITVSNTSETKIRTLGVYEWDGSTFIGVTWISSGMKTFVTSGDLIKIALFPTDGTSLSTSVVNNTGTRIKLEYGSENTLDNDRFTVWNAGNVTVEPESMKLNIIANAVQSDNNFTIRNITTGEEIVLNRASTGSNFRMQGMVISLGSITNIFRDTNRRFISLAPGDNQFKILNGTFGEISFEFKYLYK